MRKRMTQLAVSFPIFRELAAHTPEQAEAMGLAPFCPYRLHDLAGDGYWSGTTQLIAAFLLQVWNGDHGDYPAFDVIEAYKCWDGGNWGAFQDWANDPFHC